MDRFVAALARSLSALDLPNRLLVAVSGGADSVALLEAAFRARTRRTLARHELVVGHVNHRLRADSALDAELAGAHAERLRLPFALAAVSLDSGSNLEESAREARYAALSELARAHRCEAILTAHTATDQAETLLFRLARGSGARGLAAMAPKRKLGDLLLARPLLHATREETRAFCERETLDFRDDPTNLNDRPRARLRAEVLPALERVVPGATRNLAKAADRLREDDRLLESLLPAAALEGDRAALASLAEPLKMRALARFVEHRTGSRRRLSASHLAALGRLVATGRGEVELPSGPKKRLVAALRADRLTVDERPDERPVRRSRGGSGVPE